MAEKEREQKAVRRGITRLAALWGLGATSHPQTESFPQWGQGDERLFSKQPVGGEALPGCEFPYRHGRGQRGLPRVGR